MAAKRTPVGTQAAEYCKKFPSAGNMTIAKKLFKEFPTLYNTLEDARSAVRYYRGSKGQNHRDNAAEIIPRIELPESDVEDWTPYSIPVKKLLILCDIHVPFHDVKALRVAIKAGEGCDGVLINGDLFDFYKGSRFEQDPRRRSMAQEIEMGKQVINYIKQELGCPIYFKYGNHDERWDKYIMLKAPELYALDGVMLEDRLLDTGVHIIKDKRIIKHGHLDILHGHEFFGAPSQAVNPARGLFMKTIESCLIGHLHKTSSHTETSMSGKMITTHSVGALCGLHPEYARLNKWNHGFAISELIGGNEYQLHNKRIFNGKVY